MRARISRVRDYFGRHRGQLVLAVSTSTALALPAGAFAAASPTTGIDYGADLVSPVKSELTLAIVAGLGLMVVLLAVRAGTKLVKSFGK